MKLSAPLLIFTLLIVSPLVMAGKEKASVASIKESDLVGYDDFPFKVKRLVEYGLSLTRKRLVYKFGSNDPKNGGMDCSGTVQHTLSATGWKDVPRMAHTIYKWAEEAGKLKKLNGVYSLDDPAFDQLKPGDLLFWEGTYSTEERDPPISHVMIYIGRSRIDGEHVVYGASSGRYYRGKRINGVSVFDFSLPSKASSAKFVAYGPPPGLD